MMLQWCCEEFRNDAEICTEALKQNGLAFQYLSDELKANEEMQNIALEDPNIADKPNRLDYIRKMFPKGSQDEEPLDQNVIDPTEDSFIGPPVGPTDADMNTKENN